MENRRRGRELPRPLPEHLRPRLVEPDEGMIVVGGDLRFVASLAELVVVGAVLARTLDLDDVQVLLTHREGSPWIEIAAVPVPSDASQAWPDSWAEGPVQLALWRYTLDVYRVGADGAVEEDPIYRFKEDNAGG